MTKWSRMRVAVSREERLLRWDFALTTAAGNRIPLTPCPPFGRLLTTIHAYCCMSQPLLGLSLHARLHFYESPEGPSSPQGVCPTPTAAPPKTLSSISHNVWRAFTSCVSSNRYSFRNVCSSRGFGQNTDKEHIQAGGIFSGGWKGGRKRRSCGPCFAIFVHPQGARRETLFYHTRGPHGVLFLVEASTQFIITTPCCFPLLSSQQMPQSYWDQE